MNLNQPLLSMRAALITMVVVCIAIFIMFWAIRPAPALKHAAGTQYCLDHKEAPRAECLCLDHLQDGEAAETKEEQANYDRCIRKALASKYKAAPRGEWKDCFSHPGTCVYRNCNGNWPPPPDQQKECRK